MIYCQGFPAIARQRAKRKEAEIYEKILVFPHALGKKDPFPLVDSNMGRGNRRRSDTPLSGLNTSDVC